MLTKHVVLIIFNCQVDSIDNESFRQLIYYMVTSIGVEATVEVSILEFVSGFDISVICDLPMLEDHGEL